TTDGQYAADGGCAQLSQAGVPGRLDSGDPFQQALKKTGVFRRAWREPGRQQRVAERKAFARGGERIVVETGVLRGIDGTAQCGHPFRREEPGECGAAAVG
ncbi:hypothetical protein RZS08_67415, partial [Arthrospira platensis SPKY1]|nr:hypothetical protein [Arthrospira platensis SPKY1]